VIDGDPAHYPKMGGAPPIFGPHLLWPNGCMDEDAIWYGGSPRPTQHCVTWGPSSPLKGNSPQFSANVHCGQTAGWTMMSLGTEVGLGPGVCVRWGPSYPQKKGHTHPQPIASLGFIKFRTVERVKEDKMHHRAKFCSDRSTVAEIWQFFHFSR